MVYEFIVKTVSSRMLGSSISKFN